MAGKYMNDKKREARAAAASVGDVVAGGVLLPNNFYGPGAYRVPNADGMATDYGAPGSPFARMYPHGIKVILYQEGADSLPDEVKKALAAAAAKL